MESIANSTHRSQLNDGESRLYFFQIQRRPKNPRMTPAVEILGGEPITFTIDRREADALEAILTTCPESSPDTQPVCPHIPKESPP